MNWKWILFLMFLSSNALAQTLNRWDLLSQETRNRLSKVPVHKITTPYDPAYRTPTLFWAYTYKDFLKLSGLLQGSDNPTLALEAADGYQFTLQAAVLNKPGCHVAFALGQKKGDEKFPWKNFAHGKEPISPGPFYIVWQDGFTTNDSRPWSWQLVAISLYDPKKQNSLKPKDPRHNKGFQIFQTHCQKCHSINLIGGAIGFEMNVPKNVTEYLNFDYFQSFAQSPRSYRARSPMPEQKLSTQDFKAVWDYLQDKSHDKVCTTSKACENL